ncbi:pentatricopeptide repeat-containing protein At3g03580 [Nymphaea colorata]|uniref:DYW domain-containing protein n=1 Tax=Nymphaea colorata TaxID=210225 RepID=A0A5K0W6U6_9MAGN|nr:pentatricopeptide repeat-containing protein At3g03580 [Nymphaea colorata]XP_031500410.1 pentatricopeptide repeat-containing protein At3g03580 [Nymphaea colorata]XP_031500416.1 pentatricopeptide repeat-containing protein At3g03580 [Nymphaea colorata]XP_031500425.1 pentatricopeptide repeat-containing protein At3g03580 [Nymphaea colorata]XP_031500436.1 pentatricopeptide repeat-containing protein At3g03580 [Nymphaea colorata]XP_049937100.1 pentatricopeptide repeat-containing protein At3g03580 [
MRCLRRSWCSFSASPGGLPRCVLAAITSAVSSSKSLQQTGEVHARILVFGLHHLPFFSGKLIVSYAKHGNPHLSRLVFKQVSPTTNIFLWNSVIRAFTNNGYFSDAIDTCCQMHNLGLVPDRFTLPSLINACAGLIDLETGKKLHERAIALGFEFDIYVANSLIDMYAKCGSLNDAHKLFVKIPQRDIVSWNALISGYASNKQWDEALLLYYEFRLSRLEPDLFTVGSVLLVCGGAGDLLEGQLTHGIAHKIGIERNISVGNALLSMYAKCNSLDDVCRVFYGMPQRDIVTWNTMISTCIQFELFREAIEHFRRMILRFKPDLLTVTTVLHACGHLEDLEQGKSVHEYLVRNGYKLDATLSNVLITMYGRCGCLKACQEVFDQRMEPDLVAWNALTNACIQCGYYREGMQNFKRMKRIGMEPDSVTFVTLLQVCSNFVDLFLAKSVHSYIIKAGFENDLLISNLIIDTYAKCDSVHDAMTMFEIAKVKDVMSWNAIISGSIQCGSCNLGLTIFRKMNTRGVLADKVTMLGILPAFSFLGSKRHGKEVHGFIFKVGLDGSVPVNNAMINMYSKCGDMKYSFQVFASIKEKDVVTWTTMIYAYGMHGFGKKAVETFTKMEEIGEEPDSVAFIAAMYACSHAGLVDEGLRLFSRMQKCYQIEPKMEHYACVVDLLSRSGKQEEAEKWISSMPLEPDASVWGALLSSCRKTGETKIAERVSAKILNSSDSYDAGYLVLVSNMYASNRKWNEVSKIRRRMRARGWKKIPGYSWLEIKNRVYVFGNGDRRGEQSEELYCLLERLGKMMAKDGYIADERFVLHDVEEDEKVDMLCGHSERLAIAFAILNTTPGTPLLIMKNLRVCGDCHTVTKYISKIFQRELTVRDANRFHYFKQGTCSCDDYW